MDNPGACTLLCCDSSVMATQCSWFGRWQGNVVSWFCCAALSSAPPESTSSAITVHCMPLEHSCPPSTPIATAALFNRDLIRFLENEVEG